MKPIQVTELNQFINKPVSTKWAAKGMAWILFAFRNPKVSTFRHMYYQEGDTKAVLKSTRSQRTFEVSITDLTRS